MHGIMWALGIYVGIYVSIYVGIYMHYIAGHLVGIYQWASNKCWAFSGHLVGIYQINADPMSRANVHRMSILKMLIAVFMWAFK